MNFNTNLFTPGSSDSSKTDPTTSGARDLSRALPSKVSCPVCTGDLTQAAAHNGWQNCPYCGTRLRMSVWSAVRPNTNATVALSDQATCFFHPDKAFQTCCLRCGRFLCALCDLQLGAEHICPACFERGLGNFGVSDGKAEWRHRDVLYDSIALTVGWCWILFWPTIVAAIPTVIVLHVKFRKAPRSSLIPRYGWRFWVAYLGFAWLPILLVVAVLSRFTRRP